MVVLGEIQVGKRHFQAEKIIGNRGRVITRGLYLNVNIFNSWKEAKIEAGYSNSSDSDLASHLLSLEFRRK